MKLGKCALLTCLLALVGCGKSHTTANIRPLRVNITAEPQTLDSRKVRSLNDMNVLRIVGDGLTRVDSTGKAHLSLAEKYTLSDDQKTYTFHLKDAKWSNGEAVTASDFVYTWKKILSPEFPASNASQLYVLKNAKAVKESLLPMSMLGLTTVNEKTFVVELANPIPYFLDLLATPTFYPINSKVDKSNPNWAQNPETYVSCGPFRMSEWKHNDQLKLIKNPSYWDASRVKLDGIELYMVDQDTEAKMFEAGELDWMGSPFSTIPVEELEPIKKKNKLITEPFLGTNFIRTNIDETPFDSKVIRKAFAMALNREDIVTHVLQGNQIPTTHIVPMVMGLKTNSSFQDNNCAAAKEMLDLELAKYDMTVSSLPKITMKYPANSTSQKIAQAIQAQWKEALDVDIHLLPVEQKVFFDQVGKQDYQLAFGDWIADYNDAASFLEVFRLKANSTNNTGWQQEDYIKAMETSATTKDSTERNALLASSESILLEELPIIPLFQKTLLYSKSDHVTGVITTSLGSIDFKWAKMGAQHAKAHR